MTHLKQQNHGLTKSFEIVDTVQRSSVFHIHKEGHSKDGKNEHDKEK